jgi:parvulin-like peptidyl-prolyl isomerase
MAVLAWGLCGLGPLAYALAAEPAAPAADARADAAARRQFEACPWAYDEYRLRHIFIAVGHGGGRKTPRSDAEALARARALKHQLDTGADFERLAQRESDDAATAPLGGELSSIFGVYLADEFLAAVRGLAVGQVSGPTRGPEGYHLIRLEERHAATFDSAKALIREQGQVKLRAGAAAIPAGCAAAGRP